MNLVSVEGVSKAYPELPILDDVTMGIHDGDRIGVIGANGSGKSTLLSIIAGTIDVDGGRVVRRSGTRIALLAQEPDMDPDTTLAAIAAESHPTLVLLDRLGFKDLDQRIGDISGGQRRRVALAQCLAIEADITILDEPTNHLDVEVIDWLEDELAVRPGALVMVTHDRYVLDRVCTSIVEVHNQKLMGHRGTYQEFLVARAERESLAEATEQKRQNRARTELAWLERSPKARTGKQKARIKSATQLVNQESGVIARSVLEFDLPTRRIGSKVVNLDNVGISFGDNAVLAGITWHLAEDARIGIVGPNGAGKTTLLRLIANRIAPTTGKVSMGDTIVAGWYGQDPEPMRDNQRILETIREISEQTRLDSGISISASQLLERFGFPSRQHSTLVGELSGGERRRLELLRVLAEAPNLLMLDEPTNDLDLDTLGALEPQRTTDTSSNGSAPTWFQCNQTGQSSIIPADGQPIGRPRSRHLPSQGAEPPSRATPKPTTALDCRRTSNTSFARSRSRFPSSNVASLRWRPISQPREPTGNRPPRSVAN